MKKILTILFAALTLSVGVWAETQKTVSYRYPVYNTSGDASSGIKKWQTATVEAIVVENASDRVSWLYEWYVVTGTNVQLAKGVICSSAVHLIIADGAKLTVTGDETFAGIYANGDCSLTIYGQSQSSGKLIVNGIESNAGIGGGSRGSNITINGGVITVTGGNSGAGIGGGSGSSNIIINGGKITATGGQAAAGIGGESNRSGSNIIINGGDITANGGDLASGIGDGYRSSGSNITINDGTVTAMGGLTSSGIGGTNVKVATSLVVKADNNNPPTTVIRNSGTNIADQLAGKQYATVVRDPLLEYKTAAIKTVNAEIAETDNDNVKAIATNAATAIHTATTEAEVNTLKTLAIAAIDSAKAAYKEAYTAGEEAVKATLPTKGTTGPAVVITNGDKSVTLINPDEVRYTIVTE